MGWREYKSRTVNRHTTVYQRFRVPGKRKKERKKIQIAGLMITENRQGRAHACYSLLFFEKGGKSPQLLHPNTAFY
jgi:hypothetical protein